MDKKCSCGPFWMPKFIRCTLSNKFNKPCIEHDKDYEEQIISRWKADIKFFKALLDQSNNIGHVFLAVTYFVMVRIGGIFSYGKQQ